MYTKVQRVLKFELLQSLEIPLSKVSKVHILYLHMITNYNAPKKLDTNWGHFKYN
jgi:hypothetical protein